jgi:Uncharacterised nucleotidyltransferase
MLGPLTPAAAVALLSPSARLLAAAAAPDAGASQVGVLPWHDVHWPTLLSLTSFERAEAQVFRLLRSAPDGAVPDAVQQSMQGIYRVAAFRSAELGDAAAVAADALQAAGVTPLWLKGAALAMQSPEEFGVRSMGDLDLLVDPAELPVAREALEAAGWRRGIGESYASHHHDVPMIWRGGIRLELHTGLFPPGHPFAPDGVGDWVGRSVPVSWGSRTVRVLPPAWHLLHATVHWAWNHEGEVGSWQYLHDAHRLSPVIAAGAGGWSALLTMADQLGARRPVGWGLWAAHRLAAVPVDPSVVEAMRGGDRWLGGLTEREWILRAFHSPAASPSVRWSRFWWRRAMHGLGDDRAAWPWALGRSGHVVETPGSVTGLLEGRRLARWRRHLGRVLGG